MPQVPQHGRLALKELVHLQVAGAIGPEDLDGHDVARLAVACPGRLTERAPSERIEHLVTIGEEWVAVLRVSGIRGIVLNRWMVERHSAAVTISRIRHRTSVGTARHDIARI